MDGITFLKSHLLQRKEIIIQGAVNISLNRIFTCLLWIKQCNKASKRHCWAAVSKEGFGVYCPVFSFGMGKVYWITDVRVICRHTVQEPLLS